MVFYKNILILTVEYRMSAKLDAVAIFGQYLR